MASGMAQSPATSLAPALACLWKLRCARKRHLPRSPNEPSSIRPQSEQSENLAGHVFLARIQSLAGSGSSSMTATTFLSSLRLMSASALALICPFLSLVSLWVSVILPSCSLTMYPRALALALKASHLGGSIPGKRGGGISFLGSWFVTVTLFLDLGPRKAEDFLLVWFRGGTILSPDVTTHDTLPAEY